jgi:hypothetical protein
MAIYIGISIPQLYKKMAMYNTPYVDMSDAAADEIINTPTLSFGKRILFWSHISCLLLFITLG